MYSEKLVSNIFYLASYCGFFAHGNSHNGFDNLNLWCRVNSYGHIVVWF